MLSGLCFETKLKNWPDYREGWVCPAEGTADMEASGSQDLSLLAAGGFFGDQSEESIACGSCRKVFLRSWDLVQQAVWHFSKED